MKKLLIILGALGVLLVAAYFVVTSSGFLKAVVLPRVGASLNARVEADSIALRPFSSVEIRKLTVIPNGAEPLASVELARVRYRLFAILGGRLELDEVWVGSPAVTLVQKADGSSNLDPILKKLAEGTGAQPAAAQPGPAQPVQLDLKSFRIENGTLSYRSASADGATLEAGLSGLGVTGQNLRNGGTGRLDLTAGLRVDQRPGSAAAPPAALQAQLAGGFDLGLSSDLLPVSLGGKLEAQLRQASGAFAEFQGFSTVLSAALTPGELTRLTVDFARQGTALGSISARGPLDLTKKEAKLQVEVAAIDRHVLNLLGAAQGLDFTTTRFDSTNRLEVTGGGQRIAVNGSVVGSKVSVKKGDLTLPPVDLAKTYDLAVNLEGQSATIRTFSLTGNQNGREVIRGTLSQPMQVSWAANAGTVPDAAVDLQINDLRLADWSALAGTPLQGSVKASARLGVKGGGKDLALDATSELTGLSGTFASNQVRNLSLKAAANLGISAFADPAKRRLIATATVDDLSGEAAVVRFDRYRVAAKADVGLPEGAIALNEVDLRLREGTREGGQVTLKGRWDTRQGGGDLTVAARDVNEAALRPFLQAALGDKQLTGVKLVADAGLKLDPKGDVAVKATADVRDLVVKDPSGTVPESPLAVGLALDAGGSGSKLTIRQADLKLTPTPRAKNQLGLTGNLDFSKTNALVGDLKLAAESLDVTPYYDLSMGGSKPSAPSSPTPAPGPQKEPDPVALPVESLTVDARIGKFFLKEVAAENFVAILKIRGSRIEVQPFELALNGAPVKAGVNLDLGVPGYTYDVKLHADRVPVMPFANSFVPMLKDRIGGAMNAGLEVKGAGVTGTSLQKSLAGGMQFAVTNANLKLTEAASKKGVLTILASLLASALNIPELRDQPIMDITAQAKMGGGRIDLTQALIRSASLEAGSTGSIAIASDLMQSPLDLPVTVALRRDLAQRARLVGADTPTNATYVAIPPLASVKGTLGAPAPEVDKVRAGALAARGLAGLVGGQAGQALGGVADLVSGVSGGGASRSNVVGNVIQSLGGLLGGRPATNTAATGTIATNAPATNAPVKDPVGGLLRGLLEPKKNP